MNKTIYHCAAILVSCLSFTISVQGAEFKQGKIVTFHGATDGSAAVVIDQNTFIGASDENNVLRIYAKDGSSKKDLPRLDLGFPPNQKGEFREYDIEGAASLGKITYWIGSHGRNSDGEIKAERRVLFATTIVGTGDTFKVDVVGGKPYTSLINGFENDPKLKELNLADAVGSKDPDKEKAPKMPGALNIESLCADGGDLLIGFRNPTIRRNEKDCALIVRLTNAEKTVRLEEEAKFGKPILLDLGGFGIRDMVKTTDGFLVIAGDYRDRFDKDVEPSRLYLWSGKQQDSPKDLKIDFGDLNPEAILIFPSGKDPNILILSDDGAMTFDGHSNKKNPPDKQTFRGVWLLRTDKSEQ